MLARSSCVELGSCGVAGKFSLSVARFRRLACNIGENTA